MIDQSKTTSAIALHATSALAHLKVNSPPEQSSVVSAQSSAACGQSGAVSTRSVVDLPEELIAKIFRHLGESSKFARSTCRKFDLSFAGYCSKAHLNWPGNPAYFEFPSKDRFSSLQTLQVSGPWFCFPVTRLHTMPEYQNLNTCEFRNAQGFRNWELAQVCKLPNLKNLHLDNSSVDDTAFNHLINIQKQLVSLSLTRSQLRGRDIDSAARPLIQLTFFDLSGSEKTDRCGFDELNWKISQFENSQTSRLRPALKMGTQIYRLWVACAKSFAQ